MRLAAAGWPYREKLPTRTAGHWSLGYMMKVWYCILFESGSGSPV